MVDKIEDKPAKKKSAADFMAKLLKADTAFKRDYDPFAHILRFSSPGMNFIFGNTQGLPLGQSLWLWGPNKSGKTILCYDLIAQMHRDYPEAIAIRFDTEFRDAAQLTPAMASVYGIDLNRYVCHQTNSPDKIFDYIENELDAICQEGAQIKLVIIDSLTMVKGRRAQEGTGIDVNLRGDDAQTHGDGLKRIWETLHRNKIALVITGQARAEQDANLAKYNPYKAAGAWALKHFAGYSILVEPAGGEFSKQTLLEEAFADEGLKDGAGRAEQTGHRIRATMKGSSFGPKNRRIEFTFDYNKGIINRHEEVFLLAKNRGLMTLSGSSYTIPDFPTPGEQMKFNGGKNVIRAIRENEDLYGRLLDQIYQQDLDLAKKGAGSIYYRQEETKDE